METVIGYLGLLLVGGIFLFLAFLLFWFLYGLLRVWVLMCETSGMSRRELKKAEQEMCKHYNTVYTENHPEFPWTCCDCGKNV